MASFQDTAGRVWQVDITVGHLPKLKALGFDLGDLKGEAVHRVLYADPLALVAVLRALCPGAGEDFLADAGRDVLDDASAALDEALVDFFLRRPLRAARNGTPEPSPSTTPSGGSPASSG